MAIRNDSDQGCNVARMAAADLEGVLNLGPWIQKERARCSVSGGGVKDMR
jgi:hypothetical protein